MPRNFTCPATDSPCAELQCNYKATGYCLKREREDLSLRRADREKERKRHEEAARLVEEKRRRQRRIELLRKRIGPLTF